MKFGQVVKLTREIIFFKIDAENEAKRLVPDFFLIFGKVLHEIKASSLQLIFNHFQ